MTHAEALAKLDAEIAEAKIDQGKLLDDRYFEGESDGYLEGLEFARALLAAIEPDSGQVEREAYGRGYSDAVRNERGGSDTSYGPMAQTKEREAGVKDMRPVEAVKMLRERSQLGLKECLDWAKRIAAQHPNSPLALGLYGTTGFKP